MTVCGELIPRPIFTLCKSKSTACRLSSQWAANGSDVLLAKLGQHKTGKVCVYIRRLANVDLKVLEKLVARSVAETKSRYPQPNENDA
jgi:hypothetical protein